MTILGLDVGSPQGLITLAQWRAIRAEERRFAFLRCAEGLGGVDGTFASNVAGARPAGLAIGPYFVLHPWLDPDQQVASWFAITKLGTAPGELPPVIDIELDHSSAKALTPAQVLAALIATVRAMALTWARPPIVYTYPDFEKRDILAGGDVSPLASSILWLAKYAPVPPPPPKPWSTITFWQDSGGDHYRIPSGWKADSDEFLGDEEAFARMCDPTAAIVTTLASEMGA